MSGFLSLKKRINRGVFLVQHVSIYIAVFIITFLFSFLSGSLGNNIILDGILILLFVLFFIFIFIFQIILVVGRFHDLNKPAWHFFLLLIPFYNIYILLVLYLMKGTEGPNEYGEDPLTK